MTRLSHKSFQIPNGQPLKVELFYERINKRWRIKASIRKLNLVLQTNAYFYNEGLAMEQYNGFGMDKAVEHHGILIQKDRNDSNHT